MIAGNAPLVLQLDALEIPQLLLPPRLLLLLPCTPVPRLAFPAALPITLWQGRSRQLARSFPALGRAPARRRTDLGGALVAQGALALGLGGDDAVSAIVATRAAEAEVFGVRGAEGIAGAAGAGAAEQGLEARADVGRVGGVDRLGAFAGALGVGVLCPSACVLVSLSLVFCGTWSVGVGCTRRASGQGSGAGCTAGSADEQ